MSQQHRILELEDLEHLKTDAERQGNDKEGSAMIGIHPWVLMLLLTIGGAGGASGIFQLAGQNVWTDSKALVQAEEQQRAFRQELHGVEERHHALLNRIDERVRALEVDRARISQRLDNIIEMLRDLHQQRRDARQE